MKKIAIVTSTRAEYGLLLPVIRELRKLENSDFQADLIVTGTHLSEKHGLTINDIKQDAVRIDKEVCISLDNESADDISSNQADALKKFTDLFAHDKYDAVILLGDRYEMLAIAIAAGNTMTPIFHLCGGDTTEGAVDEWIRHSITKMSYLHFVTNEESRKRVIQLGESPDRVFNYGSTSIDNILNAEIMTKEQALESVSLADCQYALCTYHPVTMEIGNLTEQMNNFLEAIQCFPTLQFIVTKSNADQGGDRINQLLDEAEAVIPNLHVFTSLGMKRYLSLMKHAEFVLGNSSSGIIEAPAFHVPTVNIGDRQKGRLQSESIVNCAIWKNDIMDAIKIALSDEHKDKCRKVISPYGDGHAAERIAEKSYQAVMAGNIDLRKQFYNILVYF